MRHPRTTALVALALVAGAVALPSPAGAARREHTVHGTVRKLCDTVQVRKWPHGPSVGRVARGRDMRRYHFEGAWALGVTTRRPFLRGYVLVDAFCAASARGRRAADAARLLASHPPRGRAGIALRRPLLRRVCAPVVYLRDRPLNRAIALLYVGDAFRATRRARNPWLGGLAHGHAARRGWIPRSALCRGLGRRAARHVAAAGPRRSTVLAPPAVLRCGELVFGRRMLQVGVRGSSTVGAELRDGAGRIVSSARFTHGRPGRWSYAPVGPYRCGHSYVVAYAARGAADATFPVRITSRRAPAAARQALATLRGVVAAATRPTTPRPRAAAPSCRSRPQRRFAHGGRGPVDHRFHARPAISADGRFVAFDLPAAGLVAGDRNAARDVFVRDSARGRTRLASVALDGGVGDATSRAAAISADGHVVAFESSASNLVAHDRNGVRDVFVRDMRSGVTLRIAPGRSPALSADGRRVAFEQSGTVQVAGLHDAGSRRVARLAYRPALSADGRYVAYETRLALSPHDDNRDWDVYRTRLDNGRTVLLSAGADGRSRRGSSLAAVLSADGSVAAFQSDAPLVHGDSSGLRDVLVRDVGARRTVLASANRCGRPADGYSRYPSISADGRRVAFDSHATDLVSGVPRGRGQVYLRDLGAHRTSLLSRTRSGRASARTSFSPALAARAGVVAFPTFGYDLGPRDANGRVDIYRRAARTGRTQRLSVP